MRNVSPRPVFQSVFEVFGRARARAGAFQGTEVSQREAGGYILRLWRLEVSAISWASWRETKSLNLCCPLLQSCRDNHERE